MKSDRLSVRLKPELQRRFVRVAEVSQRTYASILRECLSVGLTKLERKVKVSS